MFRYSMLAAAAVAVSAQACVHKPTMQLVRADVSAATPAGIGLTVLLKVKNDNSFDVEVRNVRVQTTVQDRWVLPPVAYSPNQWLPADATTLVQAPVVIPWPLVLPLLAETATSPTISYHVKGSADVTAVRSLGIQSNDYPVDEGGTIPRSQIVAAAQRMLPFAR